MTQLMRGDLQDIPRFTVQILDRNFQRVAGTGFIASAEGAIITCAHVLSKLGIGRDDLGAEVGIYGPTAQGRLAWQGVAQLCATSKSPYEDDAALLMLLGERKFASNEQAHLGTGSKLDGAKFKTYGFPDLDVMSGGDLNDGRILGSVPPPGKERWRYKPLRVSIPDGITLGMSGSPVLEKKRNHVVGVLFGSYADPTWASLAPVAGL